MDKIQDAINCGVSKNYTSIPNDVIRNPNLSAKAKTILFTLLSNKEGWKSYQTTICKFLKEGASSIKSGLTELETNGFLLRIRYRDKKTKVWKGCFWAYGDVPWYFNVTTQFEYLENKGLEPQVKNPLVEKLLMENPLVENQLLIILINKNTKRKNLKVTSYETEIKPLFDKNESFIKKEHFEDFWKLYPSKKRNKKGTCLTKWIKICNQKDNKPTWKSLQNSLELQKQSEQWQNSKYIPLATTWLNNMGWLNSDSILPPPEQTTNKLQRKSKVTIGSRQFTKNKYEYEKGTEIS